MGSAVSHYFKHAQDAVHRLAASKTINEVGSAVVTSAKPLGYHFHCFARPPHAHWPDLRARKLLIDWPTEWFCQYDQDGIGSNDPIASALRKTTTSFRWSDVRTATPESRRVMQMAADDYGMKRGFCVPIYGLNGYEAGLSFAGFEVDDSPQAQSALELIAVYAFNQIAKIRADHEEAQLNLTARQREVMLWVGQGKSNWEISQILSVKQDTINKTVCAAMRRLGVHSRTQATAIMMQR